VNKGAFFFNKEIKNNSADVEIDARGVMHAAYAYFVPNAEHPRAVYTFCTGGASVCANPTAWQSVVLSDNVREVQLEVTAAGQPRLLIVSDGENLGVDHSYATCDQNCVDANAWTITYVVTTYNATDVLDNDQPQRSFALAPDGHPAFITNNRNYQYAEPDLYGAYYFTCYSDCGNTDNWKNVPLSIVYRGYLSFDYEKFNYPSLTFTSDGKARFIARVYALNENGSDAEDGLYYYGCDEECHLRSNWKRTYLLPAGGGVTPYPGWDIAMDSGDRPRIALATGDSLNPPEYNHQLLYVYCETNCFVNGENWRFDRVVTATVAGEAPDVEIDAQGRPRIAWVKDGGDLGFAWCNTGCHTGTPSWQNQVVETESMLRQENPQVIPPHCRNDLWNGRAPVLSLDKAGNPHIAYDLAVSADCYYDNTPGDPTDQPTVRFEPIWRGVHLTYFPQP
jgi:hypothetical protein